MHLLETGKNPENSPLGKYIKNPKKPTGLVFYIINPGFFQTLL
jgi:hypothetical protein